FFAGWIHFRLLIRFDRLKKKIFTDVEGRIISGSGRCFNTIWRMNKNRYGLPRPGSKGTVPQGDEAPGEPVPYHSYCLRPAALS
ncbi:TPA: hypothetical protein ACRR7C_001978, partial [Neisseria gonorrhoeae]